MFAERSRHEELCTAQPLACDPDLLSGYAARERERAAQLWPDEHLAADGLAVDPDGADAVAARAAAMTPGPGLAAALAAIRPGELGANGRLDFLLAQQRLASWAESLVQPVLVDHVGLVDEPNHPRDEAQQDRHFGQAGRLAEVATALRVSETTARNRLQTARLLVGRLPLTLDALRSGHLTPVHVRVLQESVAGVDPDRLPAVEERVIPWCVARGGAGTPSSFGRSCRRAVAVVDDEASTRRYRCARSHRGVRTYALPDGMAAVEVTATAADIDVVMQALTALAGPREADDPRTLDNRRVDALVSLCLARLELGHGGQAPTPSSRPDVCVNVVVDLATLLGLADHPGELPGYGPIPAGVAHDWIGDATCWRRLVVDPVTGHLLDHGPVVRIPPPRLRRFVAARDRTCMFPGCTQRALSCDLDHVEPWRSSGRGGATSAVNLQPLCRRHHNLKTRKIWQVVANHPDRVIWQSPGGRLLTRHRPRHGPPGRTGSVVWHAPPDDLEGSGCPSPAAARVPGRAEDGWLAPASRPDTVDVPPASPPAIVQRGEVDASPARKPLPHKVF